MLVGPRASGKTTLAARYAETIVRLDRPDEAAAAAADPDAFLSRLKEPILLDEWQAVPSILGAVKRAVDARPEPGRFIVTGSVRAAHAGELWPGTGRLARIPLLGMTVREQRRADLTLPPFIDRLVEAGGELSVPAVAPDLPTYLDLALMSGFPEPAIRVSSAAAREAWLESYIDQVLTQDAEFVSGQRSRTRLRSYLEAYAANTAGLVEDVTLAKTVGITAKTAVSYEQLLTDLWICDSVPAMWSNRLKRMIKAAKRYMLDGALAAAALRMDSTALLRNGDVMGRILDTFVAAQLRAELTVTTGRPRLLHLRAEQGRHEVDLLAERAGGEVVAFEVKASSSPTASDARHLNWLRDQLGERFQQGVVFHTGPHAFQLDDRVHALPICALWGS